MGKIKISRGFDKKLLAILLLQLKSFCAPVIAPQAGSCVTQSCCVNLSSSPSHSKFLFIVSPPSSFWMCPCRCRLAPHLLQTGTFATAGGISCSGGAGKQCLWLGLFSTQSHEAPESQDSSPASAGVTVRSLGSRSGCVQQQQQQHLTAFITQCQKYL